MDLLKRAPPLRHGRDCGGQRRLASRAVFASRDMSPTSGGVPTGHLTVHILAPEALASLKPDAFLLIDFTTRAVQGGYLEEDGEIWSEDERLLAQ